MKDLIKTLLAASVAALLASATPAWAQDAAATSAAEGAKDAATEADASADAAAESAESDEPTWDDLVNEQERIVLSYVVASVAMSDAQAELADALELKDAAAKVRAEARALESATTVDKKRLEKNTKISKSTNKQIQKALKKDKELTAQQRIEFSRGMASYVLAVEQTDNVIDEAAPFVSSVEQKITGTMERLKSAWSEKNPVSIFRGGTTADGTDIGEMKKKLATGMYIGQKAPGLIVSHGKTVQQIAKYTQNNDIAVPPEASGALKKYQAPQESKGVFGRIGSAGSKLIPGRDKVDAVQTAMANVTCNAGDGEYCMWIEAYPENASIVMPDVEPAYSPGMSLAAGTYKVEVSAKGYSTRTEEIDLTQSNQRIFIELKPEA
ncbi:MAG: PEGA domain-containing protein [Pseudomonadota bacterium]